MLTAKVVVVALLFSIITFLWWIALAIRIADIPYDDGGYTNTHILAIPIEGEQTEL
jgi:hypothetical protein